MSHDRPYDKNGSPAPRAGHPLGGGAVVAGLAAALLFAPGRTGGENAPASAPPPDRSTGQKAPSSAKKPPRRGPARSATSPPASPAAPPKRPASRRTGTPIAQAPGSGSGSTKNGSGQLKG